MQKDVFILILMKKVLEKYKRYKFFTKLYEKFDLVIKIALS